MTNNFYNVNIHKFNPAEVHTKPVLNSQEQSAGLSLEEQTRALFDTEQKKASSSHARLNDLDSTILENEAYQNLDDEVFKTEYKINRLEAELKSVNEEIERAKSIKDFQRADILIMRRRAIESQLKNLNEKYGKSNIATKLSGGITSMMHRKPNIVTNTAKKCINFMSNKILPKISKKYDSGMTIKSALTKLETLNKNVDEIVTTQAPYGEAEDRYEMLSEYLNSANVIHYNISKTVGTPTFFDTISSLDKEKLKAGKVNLSNFGNMTGKKQGNNVSNPMQNL